MVHNSPPLKGLVVVMVGPYQGDTHRVQSKFAGLACFMRASTMGRIDVDPGRVMPWALRRAAMAEFLVFSRPPVPPLRVAPFRAIGLSSCC